MNICTSCLKFTSDLCGAFRETGTLRFLFSLEERTYSPPARRAGGDTPPTSGRALSEGDRALCGEHPPMPQGTDGARDKLAVLRFPVPCRAKPVAGSFCPLCAAAAAHLLFRKRSKNIGLRAGKGERNGDLPFRGKGHHAERRTHGLRRCRVYELLQNLQ